MTRSNVHALLRPFTPDCRRRFDQKGCLDHAPNHGCLLGRGQSASIAVAQTAAPPAPLPPLNVEQTAAEENGAGSRQEGEARAPAGPAVAPQLTVDQKGANPYANPNAPTRWSNPLRVSSPSACQHAANCHCDSQVVIEDKGARDLRDLARQLRG